MPKPNEKATPLSSWMQAWHCCLETVYIRHKINIDLGDMTIKAKFTNYVYCSCT